MSSIGRDRVVRGVASVQEAETFVAELEAEVERLRSALRQLREVYTSDMSHARALDASIGITNEALEP